MFMKIIVITYNIYTYIIYSIYILLCVYIYLYLSIYLSIYLSLYLSIYLSVYIYVYIYIYIPCSRWRLILKVETPKQSWQRIYSLAVIKASCSWWRLIETLLMKRLLKRWNDLKRWNFKSWNVYIYIYILLKIF